MCVIVQFFNFLKIVLELVIEVANDRVSMCHQECMSSQLVKVI